MFITIYLACALICVLSLIVLLEIYKLELDLATIITLLLLVLVTSPVLIVLVVLYGFCEYIIPTLLWPFKTVWHKMENTKFKFGNTLTMVKKWLRL